MIYDPGSPNADKNGYVRMPNVNMSEELMDLMNARRLYEANATVFQVARAMLHKAIDI
jgi:flagellar basal-body rod protein FlgC